MTIEYRGMRATVDGREWTSDNTALVAFLNAQLPGLDIPTSEPFPDYAIAQDIVTRFGAAIIEATQPHNSTGEIY